MNKVVETRILQWVAPGYEDSYSQYQITDESVIWCSQFALRNNMALAMGSITTPVRIGPVEDLDTAKEIVERLINNRLEADPEFGPMTVEVSLR